MPIYSYRCESCGHAKDVLQKVSDPLLTTCPACGADAFRKQLTAAGFQLKGSGWYVTDFKGGNAAAAPKAEGSGAETPPAAAAPAETKTPDTSAPATSSPTAAPAATPAASAPSAPGAAKPSATPGSGQ
jgi:putative FmdB family regulatory protein